MKNVLAYSTFNYSNFSNFSNIDRMYIIFSHFSFPELKITYAKHNKVGCKQHEKLFTILKKIKLFGSLKETFINESNTFTLNKSISFNMFILMYRFLYHGKGLYGCFVLCVDMCMNNSDTKKNKRSDTITQ